MTVPKHLKRDGRALFRQLAAEYGIEDAGGIALLTTACECLDRMRAAQQAIQEHGEVVLDRYKQVKINPACQLERDSRNGFLAAIKALNLDVEPLKAGPGRPPGGQWR